MPSPTDVTRRHDFVLLFDVRDGNPNGDPDAGNLPRVDPETMQGLVTDVALKRKVRDYVDVARGTEARYKIYVQHETYLVDGRKRVFGERARGRKEKDVPFADARQWMCDEFYDVRMFGAVMSMKEYNAGQVRGPVQMTFARSLDPIVPLDLSIVGPAQNAGEVRGAAEGEATTHGTMGRKAVVPYGLYRSHGFFNAHFARQTGVTDEDLDLFWTALQNMWDLDRSSSRGELACRGLWVFTHDSSLGNAPAHQLFQRVRASRRPGIDAPRSFADYEVTIEDADLPSGVSLTPMVC
jgi:CRISPR-associated protein Csd2